AAGARAERWELQVTAAVSPMQPNSASPLHPQPRQHLVGDDGCLLLTQPVELDVVLLLPHVHAHGEDQSRLAAGGELGGDQVRTVHLRAGGVLHGSELVRARHGKAGEGACGDGAALSARTVALSSTSATCPSPEGTAATRRPRVSSCQSSGTSVGSMSGSSSASAIASAGPVLIT